jgi:hypothetical protein
MFIDSLLAHPELRSSIHLLSFLKISDLKKFGKIKDGLDAKSTRVSGMRDNYAKKMAGNVKIGVSSFANLEGEVRSRVSPQIREFSIALEEM